MGPITAIVPSPREIPLGGESVTVAEFTLRDLAELQSVLDGEWPDPLAAIQDQLTTADPDTRRRLLREVYDRAEAGPAVYGTPTGHAYFSNPLGGALVVWMATRRHTEGMDPARATRLFLSATPGEIGLVFRIAHGVTALNAVARYVAVPPPKGVTPPPGAPWPELIDELSRNRGWTYDYIYSLTITEWTAARNEGRLPTADRPIYPGEDAAQVWAEQQRILYGDDWGTGAT